MAPLGSHPKFLDRNDTRQQNGSECSNSSSSSCYDVSHWLQSSDVGLKTSVIDALTNFYSLIIIRMV